MFNKILWLIDFVKIYFLFFIPPAGAAVGTVAAAAVTTHLALFFADDRPYRHKADQCDASDYEDDLRRAHY